MDSSNLSDLFAETQSTSIEVDGLRVFAVFDLVDAEGTWALTLRANSPARPQGVVVKSVGSNLEVDGDFYPSLAFWAREIPAEWVFSVHKRSDQSGSIRLWPTWKTLDANGKPYFDDAFRGNCGMLVEADDDRVAIRCSDGPGEVDFTALHVDLTRISREIAK